MARVAAQGDMRPMAASAEAMEDLKRILAGRSAFYAKADLRWTPARAARRRCSRACAGWRARPSASRFEKMH
jgi:hypothetical protein